MSKIETGGPAFPHDAIEDPDAEGCFYGGHPGMTLRDYFAAKVMQAHVTAQWEHNYATNPNEDVNRHWEDKDIAMCAYDMADAMLEARK